MTRTLAKQIAVSWLWLFGVLAPAYLTLGWLVPALFVHTPWWGQVGEAAFVACCWASVPPLYKRARAARREAKRLASPRVYIGYRDSFGEGVWCTFDLAGQAYEAVDALNSAYEGKKQFWVDEATVPFGKDYLGTTTLLQPPAPVRPRAKPKPGTPIVRQRAGVWYVQVRGFEMGYGSGEAAYRAALAAVERAHKA